MLELRAITKVYSMGSTEVHALRGVDLKFRKSEFVAVLGPSGCGKTTLLNIVGGLDRFTSGDLVINGKSTKDFRDGDWDAYRNNSIGFVFQTYNLIPHQSVIANVELALTLSGVSKSERAERAKRVLESVGLGDQLHKRPNQLSGGQMQRVAIARALINDPDILLADEPTGALDSETSLQIMELLRGIAADRLVIMVTHNPDIADKYSTRIIRLLDGLVTSDSNPVSDDEKEQSRDFSPRRTSMSFGTALSLSVSNLLTKKARTLLTAFAGSIGIIGIALIMSLSNGLQMYIDDMERDTLSSYPITIERETMDLGGLIGSMGGGGNESGSTDTSDRPLDRVYTRTIMSRIMNTMLSSRHMNDMESFKLFVEENMDELEEYVTAIQYGYNARPALWHIHPETGLYQVNPSQLFAQFSGGAGDMGGSSGMSMGMTGGGSWSEMIPNTEFLEGQYEVVAGKMAENFDEAVLIISESNTIPDMMLYSLGLRAQREADEFMDAMMAAMMSGDVRFDTTIEEFQYDEILALEYALILPTDFYAEMGSVWIDISGDEDFLAELAANAPKVRIVGILRPDPDAAAVGGGAQIGYTSALTEYIINSINNSAIVREQTANPDRDVLTGQLFAADGDLFASMDDVYAYINALPEAEREETLAGIDIMLDLGMEEDQIVTMMNDRVPRTEATFDDNMRLFGAESLDSPISISFYPSSFENKDHISAFIDRYNEGRPEGAEIAYIDFIGLLLSSVTSVINAISALLIAFVSISLIVSSIMIGIITYISVLERTREIGVLRAIGASKRDISRVFNAETLFIGFSAGVLGIVVTLLLLIPGNAIILAVTDVANLARLPLTGGVGLVIISMILTFIAGLIPSRVAARKDPVVALRTE